MSDPDHLDIAVEPMPPPPVGSPRNFRELLSLHLKTTDSATLAAAERDFRGVWTSEHDYIAEQIAEHLPPFLGWLPAATDPGKLRKGYCGQALRVWSISLESNSVMVFESFKDEDMASAQTLEIPDFELESACQVCGSRDWSITYWTPDDRPQGCDRCVIPANADG